MTHRIASPLAAALCIVAGPCLADAVTPASAATSLTVGAIKHSVECPPPKRETCVIRKPVGAGYRLLTQGITLEDSGEYWLVDFSKQLKGKQTELPRQSFRVMGKDNDIHEIEISFAGAQPPATKAGAKPKPAKKEKSK